LVLNLVNMVLDLGFVLGLHWNVRGVALGTALAEYVAAAVGVVLALRYLRQAGGHLRWPQIVDPARLRRAFVVNGDIMIRTLALMTVFVWFTSQGARHGDATLAGNAVLMQFISAGAFFLDGMAFAAEALVGRALGAAQRAGLTLAARLTTLWAGGVAVLLTLVLFLCGT
jgi:MATE family multidrug resistance protein